MIFDCVRPSDLRMSTEDLKHELAKRVESEYPKSIAKITCLLYTSDAADDA